MENLTVFHHNNVLSNKLDIRNNVRRENNYSIFRKCTNQITKTDTLFWIKTCCRLI